MSTTDGQHVDSYRRKNTLMLATLMASAAYAAGFNPPGGVWEDTAGHLPGDPIMRSTHYSRYHVFFYFNAAAFTLSVMVVVLTLIITAYPKKSQSRFDLPLWLLMGTAALAFITAYGTAACMDKFRVVLFSVMVAVVVLNIMLQSLTILFASVHDEDIKRRKLMAPLSMFALTISYVGGLNTPGGFWDSADEGHRPGDTILHGYRMRLFFWSNTGQFVTSLYGVCLVMMSGLQVKLLVLYMKIGLFGLTLAYTVGSSRGRQTTVSVICGVCAAVAAYVILHVALRDRLSSCFHKVGNRLFPKAKGNNNDGTGSREEEKEDEVAERQRRRAASLVQLLAGLAVSITYQAGMYPPGGVWQDGDKAGDPILLTTNLGRYRAFFYCNSVAFVASLLAILLGQKSYLTKHHALQAAMILDLLALIVAYAIGSCRDQISSMYVLGIAAAAVVYVVVHVQYFTLGSSSAAADKAEDAATSAMVDKKGGRFILLAILVASITYQAGLTPPGGFLLRDDIQSGHRVGDPLLLCNYPRRYKVFFYCNSVSFMMSTVLLLLLVNPSMYRPAIRSHALSLCSAVSFVCLIGAFAAGSTQHLKTSIGFAVFAAVAFFLCLPLLLTIYCSLPSWLPTSATATGSSAKTTGKQTVKNKTIYLMTLAILVGSAAYQAGLDPPGGSWQSTSDAHYAGHPVMHDNRRNRYLAFLCGNTTSFVASIYLIQLLLFGITYENNKWLKKAIEPAVVAQYLGFMVAYAAGSSREWKTSAHVGTLVTAVLAYVTAHVVLSSYCKRKRQDKSTNLPSSN